VLLATLGDAMRATSGLLRHWDTARAVAAMRHAWTTLDRLFATGLASRATR
jgi:hypothetical protein